MIIHTVSMNSGNRNLWRKKSLFFEELLKGIRHFRTKSWPAVDLKKLRPMILKRIEKRADEYPVKAMVPVAREVLRSRQTLYSGVSTLIHHVPVWTCKYCPETYIGEAGHLIHTCHGYRRNEKKKVHDWVKGTIDDIIVPVECFNLEKMFQNIIKHHERFDYKCIPAVVELCLQAGVCVNDESVSSAVIVDAYNCSNSKSLSDVELRLLARNTLNAWEKLRSGVHKLMFAYPARVCKHCCEVHVGPSGHKARTCGVFKYESWHGTHFWKRARVDDLVPPKTVWSRHPQDPLILLDHGRNYYGQAPAVVDLCFKAGASVPSKYIPMMKMHGLTAPV